MARIDAYQTDTPTEYTTGREGIQDINSALEPCHYFAIISSKVTELLRLLLKDVNDRFGRSAVDKLVDDLMLDQVGA